MKTTTRGIDTASNVPQSKEVIDHEVAQFGTEIDAYDASDSESSTDSFEETTRRLRMYSEARTASAEQGEKPTRLGRIRAKLGKLATSAMDKVGYLNARMTLAGQSAIDSYSANKVARQEKFDALSPKEQKRRRLKQRIGLIAGATVGATLGGYYALDNVAHAVEIVHGTSAPDVAIGGNIDKRGDGIANILGTWPDAPRNVQSVDWIAEIAPKDPTSLDVSSADGVKNLTGTLDSMPGQKDVYSYSQGTLPMADSLRGRSDIAHATYISSPQTEGTGLFKSTQELSPLYQLMGADISKGQIETGPNVTIIGQIGDGVSNTPDYKQNPLGAADSLVGYLTGRHDYSNIDPNHVTERIADDGTRYLTVHPESGIDSPTLELAQSRGLYVSEEAERFAEAWAPQVETGGPQPELNPAAMTETAADLATSTLRYHGVQVPDIGMPAMPNPIDIAPVTPSSDASPVIEQVQQVVDQFTSQAPAPAYDAYVPPVMEQVQQVVDQFTNQAPAPAMPQVDQVTTALQNSPLAQFLPR